MDFSDIKNMNNLKEIISNDNYYSSLFYFVRFYNRDSKIYETPYKELRFGNEEADMMNRVSIDVYKDKIILHCNSEGATKHERFLDVYKEYSEESCIIQALDQWKCYYSN